MANWEKVMQGITGFGSEKRKEILFLKFGDSVRLDIRV